MLCNWFLYTPMWIPKCTTKMLSSSSSTLREWVHNSNVRGIDVNSIYRQWAKSEKYWLPANKIIWSEVPQNIIYQFVFKRKKTPIPKAMYYTDVCITILSVRYVFFFAFKLFCWYPSTNFVCQFDNNGNQSTENSAVVPADIQFNFAIANIQQ